VGSKEYPHGVVGVSTVYVESPSGAKVNAGPTN
jgi:hypothetical protein